MLVEQHRLQSLILIKEFFGKKVSNQQQNEPVVAKLSARNKRVKRSVKIGDVVPEVSAQMEAVVDLAGPRYQPQGIGPATRHWGSQRGAVYLGDQKLPVDVPRVRNMDDDTEDG